MKTDFYCQQCYIYLNSEFEMNNETQVVAFVQKNIIKKYTRTVFGPIKVIRSMDSCTTSSLNKTAWEVARGLEASEINAQKMLPCRSWLQYHEKWLALGMLQLVKAEVIGKFAKMDYHDALDLLIISHPEISKLGKTQEQIDNGELRLSLINHGLLQKSFIGNDFTGITLEMTLSTIYSLLIPNILFCPSR